MINMKIAVLTSGILPVPAVQGGAVENLTDFYLEYNDRHQLHDITVFSIWSQKVESHPAMQSTVNHYRYIKTDTTMAKIKKLLFKLTHAEGYYHNTIEYYLDWALKQIKREHFDLILIENRPGYALRLSQCNIPLVYHLHNEKLSNTVPQHDLIYQAATKIITVSDYIKSCVQTINKNDTKSETVHNGIDLDAFSLSKGKQTTGRAEIGLSDNDFVLVFSGRINQEKGILQLIESLNKLNDCPNIKLLVIGGSFYGNSANEDSFIRNLKKKAELLKDRVIFTGFMPYEQIPDFIRMSDVAVIPSIWDDPFPTTVLEAQAMGVPIITTRRGGIPEEVTEDNAILLNTDEHFVDSLTDAIRLLYEHPEKRKAMSEISISRSQMYGKEAYARNFFKALDALT